VRPVGGQRGADPPVHQWRTLLHLIIRPRLSMQRRGHIQANIRAFWALNSSSVKMP
jgi:hypothetical protein